MISLGYKVKNRYEVIYTPHDKKFKDPGIKDSLKFLREYVRDFPDSKYENIWIDHHAKLYFSQAQYRDSLAGKDHHFVSSKHNFLECRYGELYCRENIKEWSNLKEQDYTANEEIIYSSHEKIRNCHNKSVLIVCGGPSTNSVDWQNLEYDHIWSCNHFYKNEKIANRKIDLVVLASGLDNILEDQNLLEYIEEYNPVVSFEAEQGHPKVDRINYEKTALFCESYKDVAYFNTRYRGQPGLGLRMLAYAALVGFKDIHFVGIDGRSGIETDGDLLHAFDGNKNIPNWYRKFGDDFQERQFIIFWEYMMELREQYDFNVYNLGQDCEHNVLGKLFKDAFPLPEYTKRNI